MTLTFINTQYSSAKVIRIEKNNFSSKNEIKSVIVNSKNIYNNYGIHSVLILLIFTEENGFKQTK
jgi:uncharacterized protein YvpB